MKVHGGVDANELREGVPAYHCWDFRISPWGPLAKESLQQISHRTKCWHLVPNDLQSLLPSHISHIDQRLKCQPAPNPASQMGWKPSLLKTVK